MLYRRLDFEGEALAVATLFGNLAFAFDFATASFLGAAAATLFAGTLVLTSFARYDQ